MDNTATISAAAIAETSNQPNDVDLKEPKIQKNAPDAADLLLLLAAKPVGSVLVENDKYDEKSAADDDDDDEDDEEATTATAAAAERRPTRPPWPTSVQKLPPMPTVCPTAVLPAGPSTADDFQRQIEAVYDHAAAKRWTTAAAGAARLLSASAAASIVVKPKTNNDNENDDNEEEEETTCIHGSAACNRWRAGLLYLAAYCAGMETKKSKSAKAAVVFRLLQEAWLIGCGGDIVGQAATSADQLVAVSIAAADAAMAAKTAAKTDNDEGSLQLQPIRRILNAGLSVVGPHVGLLMRRSWIYEEMRDYAAALADAYAAIRLAESSIAASSSSAKNHRPKLRGAEDPSSAIDRLRPLLSTDLADRLRRLRDDSAAAAAAVRFGLDASGKKRPFVFVAGNDRSVGSKTNGSSSNGTAAAVSASTSFRPPLMKVEYRPPPPPPPPPSDKPTGLYRPSLNGYYRPPPPPQQPQQPQQPQPYRRPVGTYMPPPPPYFPFKSAASLSSKPRIPPVAAAAAAAAAASVDVRSPPPPPPVPVPPQPSINGKRRYRQDDDRSADDEDEDAESTDRRPDNNHRNRPPTSKPKSTKRRKDEKDEPVVGPITLDLQQFGIAAETWLTASDWTTESARAAIRYVLQARGIEQLVGREFSTVKNNLANYLRHAAHVYDGKHIVPKDIEAIANVLWPNRWTKIRQASASNPTGKVRHPVQLLSELPTPFAVRKVTHPPPPPPTSIGWNGSVDS
jgi:hypothetical protein